MSTTDNYDNEDLNQISPGDDSDQDDDNSQNEYDDEYEEDSEYDEDEDGSEYEDDEDYDEEDVGDDEGEYQPEPWYKSNWFVGACMVVCPPYAIYRMWKDEKFSKTNRWLITAIDICWMLILLILLFSLLFGRDRSPNNANNTGVNVGANVTLAPGVTSDPNAGLAGVLPTLVPGSDVNGGDKNLGADGTTATSAPNAAVTFAPLTGTNTVTNNNTGIGTGTNVAGNTSNTGGTSTGSTGTTNWTGGTGTSSSWTGTASSGTTGSTLPTVVGSGTVTGGNTTGGTSTGGTVTTGGTTINPNETVWYTETGVYYHSTRTCGGTVSGATSHSLSDAQAAGKRRCPYCYDGAERPSVESVVTVVPVTAVPRPTATPVPTAEPTPKSTSPYALSVYYTGPGVYYHSRSNCLGMQGAELHTIGEAIDAGKKRCPYCSAPEPGASATPSPTPEPTPVVHIVWYTEDGKYYHAVSNCTGMTGATKHTLGEAIDASKPPCPVCNPPVQ